MTQIKKRKRLFTGRLSGYKKYLTGRLPGYKKYLTDRLSGYKKYLTGRLYLDIKSMSQIHYLDIKSTSQAQFVRKFIHITPHAHAHAHMGCSGPKPLGQYIDVKKAGVCKLTYLSIIFGYRDPLLLGKWVSE